MKFIEFLKDEFNSYSRKSQIALYVLFAIVALFGIFAIQVLFWGLGYTDMNNNFAWGVWIIGDLGLVALGGGAFFTGFFLYIFRVDKLEPIINSTVLLGWMCYLFTLVLLLFDVGQPLRAWFGFAYPNWGPHLMPISMLTEVFWCLSLYFCILCVELVPIVLKQRLLDRYPVVHAIGHYMHKLMWTMAAAGTFLSFFHQGSLGGGMWGVLYAKAQWFRPHFFFLAVVAATAGGTSFMMLIPWIAGKIMKKEVVPKETFYTLAKISGVMFIFYTSFRIYDIYSMAVKYVPAVDRSFMDLWGGLYGIWMLALELILCFVPITMYLVKKFREQEKTLVTGFIAGVSAILVSKMNVLLHGFSVPNFPWRGFTTYNPTIQEWFVFLGCIAIMTLIYMWFVKYTPLFPHLHHSEHASEGHE
ncbi:MAG TPA: polysulfide reductase NrfD [Spirochaetota bacterium]|nr:polysulfide reductase NrfD [Spirochaetota bacterium]HPQ51749.1 polysulfide reductase NrfD [Spirochaetota bacterium]